MLRSVGKVHREEQTLLISRSSCLTKGKTNSFQTHRGRLGAVAEAGPRSYFLALWQLGRPAGSLFHSQDPAAPLPPPQPTSQPLRTPSVPGTFLASSCSQFLCQGTRKSYDPTTPAVEHVPKQAPYPLVVTHAQSQASGKASIRCS